MCAAAACSLTLNFCQFPADPGIRISTARRVPNCSKVVIYGDTRRPISVGETGISDPERTNMLNQILTEAPDLIVHTGDFVRRNRRPEWRISCNDNRPLLEAGIPFAICPGNHDLKPEPSLARPIFHLVFGTEPVYRVEAGEIAFVMLDFSPSDESKQFSQDDLQLARVEINEAAEDGFAYIFLVNHYPAMTSSTHQAGLPLDYLRSLKNEVPQFRGLFAGHVHAYERFEIDGIHLVTQGAGGAPLHKLGVEKPAVTAAATFERWSYTVIENHMDESHLRVTTMGMGEDGAFRQVDRFIIAK